MAFLSDNLLGITVAFAVLLVYWFLKLKKAYNYFPDKGMSYVKTTWKDSIQGFSITKFQFVFDRWYDQSTKREEVTSYIGIRGYGNPTILILDPSLVQDILIKDFSSFQDHGIEMDFEKNPLAGHLFNMKGDQWRTLRHKLVPTFTSGKLRGMVPIMEECADKLVQEIKQDSSLQKDTNLKELFKKYSLAVIASTAFGIDPESVKDPNCQFRKVLQDTVNPTTLFKLKMTLSFMIPSIFKILKLFPQESEDFILNFTQQSFEHRKKSGIKRNDFIQLLLELKEKGSVELDVKDLEQDEKESIEALQSKPPTTKLELTDKLLMAQVFVFLVGGFENTAYLVAVTMHLLSKHPEIQTRVREEVKQCQKNHGNMDYQALRDMKLLQACLDEALRLYTAVTILPRKCNKEYTLKDGNKIEKGTVLLLPTRCLQKDSKYWSDPEEFKPDRFLNGETIVPGTYFPFGDGPRICIAQRMALMIVKLMLAKLVLSFELLPSSKTKEPLNIQVVFGADNEGGFWGSFKELDLKE